MCRVARSWNDVPTGPTPAKQQIDLELACKHRERSLVPNSSTWGDEGRFESQSLEDPHRPRPDRPRGRLEGRLAHFRKVRSLRRPFIFSEPSACACAKPAMSSTLARGSSAPRPGRLGRSHRIWDLAGSLFAGASAACGGMSLPTCQVFGGKARSVRICTTR
jgi:hypothetical protein